METLKTGRVFKSGGCWNIDVSRDPSASETLTLFGTTILPLPWSDAASEADVRQGLLQRNPDMEITR